MTSTARAVLCLVLTLGGALACGSEGLTEPGGQGGAGGPGAEGQDLTLTIEPGARTFVELASPSVVMLAGEGETSIAWDVAFQGRDIFTNGGISGPGNSSAFGPLSAPTFLSDTAPETPILLNDRAGGALLDWYDYGSGTHQLFSRYHVYGLKDGGRYFKLQILSYYGEMLGAPVSALYHVRYAEVTEDGVGETRELERIDATAGGSGADDDAPSACLNLDTEESTLLTPEEAADSDDWHVCFRREGIAVNGGLSGPRGMTAADLQADLLAVETEAEIQARTAESELSLFVDTDWAALDAADYRADGVVTAFGARWLEKDSDPLAVSDDVWLVTGADGASKFLLRFSGLSADPAQGPADLTLEAKSVR